jgi:cytochrome P450
MTLNETTIFNPHSRAVEPIGPDFDPHDPSFGKCAYAKLDASREATRVSRSEQHGGFWVITRHADAKAVAHNPTVFSNCAGVAFPALIPDTDLMIPVSLDPPENVPYRKLLTPLFSPGEVGDRTEISRQVLGYLVDQFIESGKCDVYAQLTSPYAAIITLRLLGLDATDWSKYTELSHMLQERGWLTILPEAEQAEVLPQFMASYQWLFESIGAEIEKIRATPPGERGQSIIARIVDAEINGEKIPPDRLTHIVHNIYEAGLDTTAAALAVMSYRLGQDQGLQNRLRENPDLITNFVEESLRIESPTTHLLRVAKEDCTIGDAEIKAGDNVLISWAAANRDPREFDDPTTFDLDRRHINRHSVFGLGVHRCLGSHIARSSLVVGVGEILRRLADFRVDPDEAELSKDCGVIFTYRRVPATFTPAAREHCYPDDVLSGGW